VNLARAKRIAGWMSQNELEFLARTARKSRAIIEIGCYFGRSAMALADNTDGIVVCIDPYMGLYNSPNQNIRLDFNDTVYEDFLYNLSEHIKSGKLVHFRCTVDEVDMNEMPAADLVFIDGDHSYEGCKKDILFAQSIVHNGIIAGHDWGTPGYQGVDQSVRELLGEPNVVDTLWWVRV
jgi:predicted O-methyltransferase YrrM